MPNPPSKDAEVRARVTGEMFEALSAQATSRGEQLPVLVREAIAEYLARRLAGPAAPRESLLHALNDKPDVVKALVKLGEMLKAQGGELHEPVPLARPVHYGRGKTSSASKKDTPRKIVDIVKKAQAGPGSKPAAATHPTSKK